MNRVASGGLLMLAAQSKEYDRTYNDERNRNSCQVAALHRILLVLKKLA